jgi:hypothetical protein
LGLKVFGFFTSLPLPYCSMLKSTMKNRVINTFISLTTPSPKILKNLGLNKGENGDGNSATNRCKKNAQIRGLAHTEISPAKPL